MAKKRGKTKSISKISKIQKPTKEALHDLEILAEERKVETEVKDIEKKEEEIENEEKAIFSEEKKVEKESEKVEKLEKEIRKEVTPQTLTRFNLKDLNKGIVGAFVGVVAHFGFIYGKAIAKDITLPRALLLFAFSYLVIVVLMYETGYREIKEKRLLGIFPRRATFMYFTSLAVVVLIFFLFNLIDCQSLLECAKSTVLYKEVAVTSVLASVGAGTADLIGRN